MVLLDKEFLVDNLSSFWICYPIVFWPPWFPMRNLLLILLRTPCMWCCCFWQFDYNVSLSSLSLSYLEFVELLGYIDLCFSTDSGSSGHYLFKYSTYPFLFDWESSYAHVDMLDVIPQVSEALLISLNFFLLFLKLNNLNGPIFKMLILSVAC